MTDSLQVTELFHSIQGESTRAGLPCLFIRLAGCNLRCSYCDARYSWEEPARTMGLAEVMAWVADYPGVMTEITGGEPLCQPAALDLMRALIGEGRPVLLETNGSLAIDPVPDEVGIVMDIKCPDSGMTAHNLAANLTCLRDRQQRGCHDEIKFVLSSVDDFHWARDLVLREGLDTALPVLFSPVRTRLSPRLLAELLLAHRLNVRLQLQLHTLLWPDRDRGV